MLENIYSTPGLPAAPSVSKATVAMVGFLVDVYGLDELPPPAPSSSPSSPSSSASITALWLLHPRLRNKERMHDIASRTLHAWHQHQGGGGGQKRGLIALCFDQPNHGTRLISEKSNMVWSKGNENHAVDMVGMVKGGVADMRGLMDVFEGYLGLGTGARGSVDSHIVLGWSLGGHGAWQAFFGEDRIDAAVSVIGCPDMMGLMSDRAAQGSLEYGVEDEGKGGEFLGSKYFPPDLVSLCLKHDPKGILFGTSPTPSAPLSSEEQERVRPLLDGSITGKKLLCLFGQDDKLVPHVNSKAFLEVLEDAVNGWYREGGVSVQHGIYEGVGHTFSSKMVEDAVKFLVEVVEAGPRKDRHAITQKARI